jgi:acetyltransferase-like isoleucine patch superfamily enzyme
MMKFNILHDTGKSLCFVGTSYMNQQFYNYFKELRSTELVTWEDALTKPQAWFDDRQFHAAISNTGFKKQVVESIAGFSPDYFSIIEVSNVIDSSVKIGKNVYIHGLNFFTTGDIVIGDHTTITTHTVISHATTIGSFSYVCPFVYTCFCTIGDGVAIGHRSSIIGSNNTPISVVDWTNLITNSIVTKNIDVAATYYGNRFVSKENSLEKCIL